MIVTQRERERQRHRQRAEGEAGSMQGARCGTPSQDSGITPWAEGRHSTTEPPRRPPLPSFNQIACLADAELYKLFLYFWY